MHDFPEEVLVDRLATLQEVRRSTSPDTKAQIGASGAYRLVEATISHGDQQQDSL